MLQHMTIHKDGRNVLDLLQLNTVLKRENEATKYGTKNQVSHF